MQYAETVLDLIGDTPLVKLNRMADARMATVLVKLENYNPAGSVKDRMAWNMVRRAEEAGILAPGATLVESTSGNTGLGLAMTAAVRGYRCVCTMPDKMSKEKVDMLKAYGAEVVITRTDLPHDHPESYVEVAKRIAADTPGGFYTDQYFNMHNPETHYLTTGPEIWEQTDGRLDALVGGIGTGGRSRARRSTSRSRRPKPAGRFSSRAPTRSAACTTTRSTNDRSASPASIGSRASATISWSGRSTFRSLTR